MISQFLSNNPFIPPINSQLKTQGRLIENQNKSNMFMQKTIISTKDEQQQQQAEISKTYSVTNNKQSIKVTSHVLTRRSPEGYKNLRAKTIRVGKIRWPPPINTDETDHANQQRRLLIQRRIKEEIHGNEQIAKDHISNDKKSLLSDYDDDTSANEMIFRNKKSFGLMLDKESYQLRKNLFEHLNKSSFVDLTHNSKSNNQQQIRATSQNTSILSGSSIDVFPPISAALPTILDEEDINQTIRDRTFSEDIYDRLTYQTLLNTNSYSSREQLTQSSIKSSKRRRHFNNPTNKKRLYRRRPPTYIKELKAYLAHRESSVNDVVKISDVKKFSNVLVWLSGQTTPSSLIETSTTTSLIKADNIDNNHLSSITPDSVIATTQDISQSYSGVFSPTETFEQPLLIELLYLQIVHDVFSSACIRISEAERTNMKIFLSSHGVATISDINLIKTLSAKKDIIEQARQWSIYFCRLFPISTFVSHPNEEQFLGLSHCGIRLVKQSRTTTQKDALQVLETFPFDTIQYVSPIRNDSTIELTLSKKRITLSSHRILCVRQMIENYLQEYRTDGNKQESHGSNQKLTSPLLSNTSDLFKSSSQTSLLSYSQTFSELIPSTSFEIYTPKPTKNDMACSSLSVLPTGHSMMEFALQNFKIPNKRRSKKKWKTSEWTWQDYAELIKWSKSPIETPLLRHSSKDPIRIVRQCFLSIMRFMNDHTMSRGQTDIDCLHYLLKNMHKHRSLIDEILCQTIKQLTDNKSVKTDSIERGWKLLALILNHFIPSEHLQPYFVKYLHDNRSKNEKLALLCLQHYEQTLKYGGRKNPPNKGEVDLLIANAENVGKNQPFILPGGYPLSLVITPSMVIDDCRNLLCERLNMSNSLEMDEYSIFIISASDHSARLLDSREYLFDITNECFRVNMIDFHFMMKRILWFNIPFTFNTNNQSETFIHFMYHQLIPELLEGTMIILNNNHLSDELVQEISLMAALQYRASNKIDLPTMREIKSLLPATILKLKSVAPQEWTTAIHDKLSSFVESMPIIEAKVQFLNLIKTWPLFGTTFFTVESIDDPTIRSPCFSGISRNGIVFLDLDTRETLFTILYDDVVSIRRHRNSIAIKYGSLSQPDVILCQIEKAQDFVTLSGRYLSLIGRSLSSGLERKSDIQQIHRSLTSICNDAISTVL
ncbi:unnamed protein product [Rotaria socialis]|uniref:MyTH4 domain-containing protein n=1 Tax=Rotaria socialis TaxID=392032 RepID=A0A820IKW7_9BILA|nr:unnamed protein product [Rotaria socialis]CAF3401521.1 unnamed protein product [Rotaria socialis]CAF3510965.1 unnamed protein product [Rotaria socialis]CAF4234736.1 unnamed protein product [Rotaria socialis]CAF4310676.1 unnamed protein product [Rotaria socialis]